MITWSRTRGEGEIFQEQRSVIGALDRHRVLGRWRERRIRNDDGLICGYMRIGVVRTGERHCDGDWGRVHRLDD